MRMTDQTLELDCGKPTLTLTQRLVAGFMPLASLYRAISNRRAVNGLHELDDNQLRDIGMTRADVSSALLTSTFFEDPSDQLTQSARQRWRLDIARSRNL